jgi:hypothetical protein
LDSVAETQPNALLDNILLAKCIKVSPGKHGYYCVTVGESCLGEKVKSLIGEYVTFDMKLWPETKPPKQGRFVILSNFVPTNLKPIAPDFEKKIGWRAEEVRICWPDELETFKLKGIWKVEKKVEAFQNNMPGERTGEDG